jgi:hypothetical protein
MRDFNHTMDVTIEYKKQNSKRYSTLKVGHGLRSDFFDVILRQDKSLMADNAVSMLRKIAHKIDQEVFIVKKVYFEGTYLRTIEKSGRLEDII